RVGGGQPHRGADRHVFEAAQDVGDIGVVEVAVLGVEADIVVASPGEFLGPDRRWSGDPAAPHGFSVGKRLLEVAYCHAAPDSVIAIFTRPGTGRQASSNAA